MTPLILKLTAAMRRLWRWRDDHYDVVWNGVMVGRIFWSPSAPKHRPWMWTSNEHEGRPPAFGAMLARMGHLLYWFWLWAGGGGFGVGRVRHPARP
jgi:hypothetical protein